MFRRPICVLFYVFGPTEMQGKHDEIITRRIVSDNVCIQTVRHYRLELVGGMLSALCTCSTMDFLYLPCSNADHGHSLSF